MQTTEARTDTAEALEEALAQFQGGGDKYQHWSGRLLYTEGVRHMAEEAGAYWLIDVVASTLPLARVRREPFQVWILTVDTDRTEGAVRMGGDVVDGKLVRTASAKRGPAYSQRLPFTDFPLPEIKLYCEWDGSRWTLMLPSER